MPVPRRFDRRPPERDTTRINERIRVPEVRLIGEDGSQIGVLKIDAALRYAQSRDLDLVEVAPEAKPPVCRVLDYSKYKYEQAQKLKQARKHQQQITIREIKFRPKIAQHDYDTKKGHVERFLKHKDKVKVTIMFRGREVTHPERGVMILDRLADELAELAIVEQRPIQDGRNMTMMLGPSKAVLAGQFADNRSEAGDAAHPAADGPPPADASPAAAPTADAPTAAAPTADAPTAAAPTAEAPPAAAPTADAPAAAAPTAEAPTGEAPTGAVATGAVATVEAATADASANGSKTDPPATTGGQPAPAAATKPTKPTKPRVAKSPVPASATGKPVRGKPVSVEPADEIALELEHAVAAGTPSGAKPA